MSAGDAIIEHKISNKDILIKGNDGGATITALTFDMSDAGAATFNGTVASAGFLAGATPGIDATVALAKITPVTGSDGSATFVKGILTAYTAPT